MTKPKERRPSRAGPLASFLFTILISVIPGCSPSGGGGTGSPNNQEANSKFQSNLDPLDPEGAVLTNETNGDRLVFFGAKNAAGEITQVQSVHYFAAAEDASPTYTISLDDHGRMHSLAGASGEQIVFQYDDGSQTATAYFQRAGAEVEVHTLDFSTAPEIAKTIFQPPPVAAKVSAVGESGVETTRTIRFFVNISLVGGGEATESFATVPDAAVQAVVLGAAAPPPPGRYDPNQGAYVFDVASRLVDAEFQAADCEATLERYDHTLLMLEYTSGLLLTACTLSILFEGGCHAFVAVGTYAAFTGLLGWDAGSQARCATLRRQAQDPLLGRVSITVSASVPRLDWSASTTVDYDIRNDSDPITQSGRADVRFEVPVSCGACPEQLICDGQRCVECVFGGDCSGPPVCSPDGRCVECLEFLHCRASSHGSLCMNEQCVGCTTAQQCRDSGQGFGCAGGRCVECTGDEDCIDDPARPACLANLCVECTNDQHCADLEAGFFCVDATCQGCRDDRDCPGEACDPATGECVPGEPAADSFHIIAYTNLDCINGIGPPGACALVSPIDPSMANIQLSGNPARPTISWPGVSNVFSVILTGTSFQPYGITGETPPDFDGNTETIPFAFSSVAYGDYNLPNVRALVPPEQAVDLVPGIFYSITLFTLDLRIAVMSFELVP